MAAQTRCIRCGNPVQGMTQFCEVCLAQQEQTSFAQASAPVSTGSRACPRCGSAVEAGAEFCGNCGTRMSAAGQAAGSAALGVSYAGFWMRLVAFIIDGIILNVIGIIVGLIAGSVAIQLVLGILIGAAYNVGFWLANDGATPGKMALGIKVQMENGEPLDVGPAVLRWVGYYVSALILLIGFIMIAFTPQKRGLHDYIAGTVVVRTR